MTQQTTTKVNGVGVGAVKELAGTLQKDASQANYKFTVKNKWIDGGYSHTTIREFYGPSEKIEHKQPFELDADEPPALAGEDRGANPVEHLLNALASCITGAVVYHAAVRGIKIDELESELVGDIDLRGLLGIADDVRPGYSNIRVNFKIKTDEQDLDKVKALSEFSPVHDVVRHGTKVDLTMERM